MYFQGHEADIAEKKEVDITTLQRLNEGLMEKMFEAETVEVIDGVHVITLKDENQELINQRFSPVSHL